MNEKGCIFLEKGIDFELDKVCDCCISHNDGRGMPVLLENYNGEPIDWENIFNIKAQRISAQKEKTIYDCENCYRLTNYQFTGVRKISDFHFSHCRLCNAKCIYCSDIQGGGPINYDVYPVISDLIEKGYYQAGGEATLQGGEPTLMKNFDALVDLLTKNGTNIRVHTNALKYSETVENALKKNMGLVVTSLDCGCSSTFFKIKQVDAFDIVCSNIGKYVSASSKNVIVKYILIPGYNDNIKEIDLFFKLINNLGVKNTALDIDVVYARKYNNKDVSPHIFLLVDYFNLKASKLNIDVQIYSFLLYVLRNRTIKKSNLIYFKFLYNIYLNKQKDKSKNLEYFR